MWWPRFHIGHRNKQSIMMILSSLRIPEWARVLFMMSFLLGCKSYPVLKSVLQIWHLKKIQSLCKRKTCLHILTSARHPMIRLWILEHHQKEILTWKTKKQYRKLLHIVCNIACRTNEREYVCWSVRILVIPIIS